MLESDRGPYESQPANHPACTPYFNVFQALLEEKSDLTNQLKMAKIILQKNPHPEVQDLGARLVARLRLQLRTCQDLLTLEYKARPR